MDNNQLKFVVLQKGKKEPVANPNGGWLLTSDINAYEDLGIYLKNQPGLICIDFDSIEENNGYEPKIIEAIQKEFPSSLVVKTDKGMHMYYKTSKNLKFWTNKMICLGIKTDSKIGNQYCVIKRNGKLRNYTGSLDLNDLTELPDILLPLKSKTAEIQAGISEGSRNDSLFHHLCRIRKFYNDIDLSKIAHFINKYLYNPSMEETEVDTIVESAKNQEIETFEAEENYSQNLYEAIEYVLEHNKIHLANNNLYFWNGEHYVNDDFELLNLVYKHCYFSSSYCENILFQLKMKAPRWNGENIIAIKNGIIKDGRFINEKDIFTPYYIDVTYTPNAYCKDLDDFLQFISNNEESSDKNDLRIVLEEMFGHCLMFKNFPHKIFLLVGRGKNGKSVLLNAMCYFFKGMYSNVPINYIDKDNYVARIVNKLANISDDIDYNYLVSSQNIKKISSGDYISARELYGKSFDFKSTATQIYSMNELVKFKDKSYGMERRLCIIPFKNEVKNVDPHMLDKLITEEAKSYFLNLALQGIERIKNNNYQLSESKIIDKTLKRYLNESDTVEMFFTYGDIGNIEERQFSVIYEAYKAFCIDNEYIPSTKNGFSRRLRTKGFVTVPRKIDNHSVRIIIKEENDE